MRPYRQVPQTHPSWLIAGPFIAGLAVDQPKRLADV